MTIDEIRELINLASETGTAELEVQRGDCRVRIRRASFAAPPQEIIVAPQAYSSQPAAAPAPAFTPPAPPARRETTVEAEKEASPLDPSLILVKSPIVGTFYEGSAPGAAPFVRVGERVQPGKVLCIIESMKLMNEIEAEVAGVIESKLVLNGQPVEYGEALFAVRAV
jgi:acetyl-CoA carboxylase biotin carboxyl carrier protein